MNNEITTVNKDIVSTTVEYSDGSKTIITTNKNKSVKETHSTSDKMLLIDDIVDASTTSVLLNE